MLKKLQKLPKISGLSRDMIDTLQQMKKKYMKNIFAEKNETFCKTL